MSWSCKKRKSTTTVPRYRTFQINILAVQETKIKGEEKTDQIQPENGIWTENTWNTILGSESTKRYTFFKGKCNNSFHGVGFITKSNLNCKFESFSNRLALLAVYIEYNNGRTHPLYIINAYAPTSNSSITFLYHPRKYHQQNKQKRSNFVWRF